MLSTRLKLIHILFFDSTWRVLQTEQILLVEIRPQIEHRLELDMDPPDEVFNIFEIFDIEL